ncbi:hypothetical protein CRUP_005476 [Coryphaenoides rupestris]|nr:hypothetical protein CRUP_005476 [Coryphaenoides rupestris]
MVVCHAAPEVRPSHNGQFCSTWGNHHFKTFDGDFFQLPLACNYVLTSQCKSSYESFNIQLQRQDTNGVASIKKVSMKLEGVQVELGANGFISVDEEQITIPFSDYGISIERKASYVNIKAKLGLVVMWNEYDTLWVELDEQFRNQTCGLCGDYNGVQIYDEFIENGWRVDPAEYGEKWKVNAPTENCIEASVQKTSECADQMDRCKQLLSEPAFVSCKDLLDLNSFVEACVTDLCHCSNNNNNSNGTTTTSATCLCPTLSEYSRQCAHAGGTPQRWETAQLCSKNRNHSSSPYFFYN